MKKTLNEDLENDLKIIHFFSPNIYLQIRLISGYIRKISLARKNISDGFQPYCTFFQLTNIILTERKGFETGIVQLFFFQPARD